MLKRSLAVVAGCALALAGCGTHHHTLAQSATGSIHPPGWGSTPNGLLAPAPELGVPTREMYDDVNVSLIPSNAFAVAGYTAGLFPTWQTVLARFPRAHHISIAISAGFHAQCLDVEPRDAVPSQAGAWVRADMRAGFRRPCVYSDLSEMPAVRASLNAAGLRRSQYLLWLAWYRFVPGLVAGYDAVQWSNRALGRSLDESTVSLAFLGIRARPPLPLCVHHRMSRSACQTSKSRASSLERAAASSERAYLARSCDKLDQRVRWFSTQLHRHPRVKTAHRRGALNTTRRAQRRRHCGQYSQRASFFSARATAARAAL